ncbi:MAG TPA: insulinase family protein [Asticcacaulis sp.]|nr:insulinase family protein [Asticcacaulis sp.]
MKISLVAGLASCVLALSASAFAAAPAPSAPMAAISFPQEHASDLKADPDVRYGRLPNGFTYVIRKNATPAGTAAVYLRIGAGSMMETERQKGLAHFLEHMAFNGTTHIPEGELKRILERHGFAFGADVNAYTSDSKTVYTLFAPKSDDENMDTALFILREIAGNMTLNPGAIDRERGVILGEERLRDKPSLHAAVALNRWMFSGQKYADYALPIGSVDIIKTAPRADFVSFYNAWYRPELATLVVVGDFDPDQMEAKVKASFANWKGKGAMPAEPDWGHYTPQGVRSFTYKEKDLPETLTLNWVKATDTSHDSQDKRIGNMLDGALLSALNRRYDNRMSEPGTAFLSAYVQRSSAYKTGRILSVYVVPRPGMARQAFEQAYDILHTFMARGVTAQEAADLAADLTAQEKAQVAGDKTRDNSKLAGDLLNFIDTDGVFLGTQDGVALLEAARPKLTQANLNARIKDLFGGDGPLLTHSGDALGDFDEGELKADYTAVSSLSAATYVERMRKPWPYTDFGPAATPAGQTADKDFGYNRYVFPNGVILNVKPTKLVANQVFVQVDLLGGMLRFDPKVNRPYAMAMSSVFLSGGLGKLTIGQFDDSLYGKQFKLGYELRDASTVLAGSTTTNDFPVTLQAMTAYVTDPGYRQDGFNSLRSTAETTLKSLKSSPGGVLAYNFPNIVHSNDMRYDRTVLEHLKDVKFDDLRAIFAESLKDTPIVVTIVGDVDEAQAVSEIGKTFGALPPRPATAPKFPGSEQMIWPPKQHEFTLYHEGRDDQSISVAVWPTNGFYANVQESRGLTVLSEILRNRLLDDLREKQGADYSPSSTSYQDDDYPVFGYIEALASIKAGGDAGFRTSLERIVADLKAKPVSDDELLRVKKPIYDSLDNNVKSNAHWITILPVMETYGDKARAAQLNRRAQYEAVTAQDVMMLARKYLNDTSVIHIKVIPTPKAVDAKPATVTKPGDAKPATAKPAPSTAKPAPVKPTALVMPDPAAKPAALLPAAPSPSRRS